MRLTPLDLDVLNRASLELYAQDDSEALYAALPAIVLRAIPADYFRLLVWRRDPASGTLLDFQYWESQPLIDAELQRSTTHWMSSHPFVAAAGPAGDLDAVKLSDFYSDRQYRETEIHREMYRPIGIGRLMGTSRASGTRLRAISVARHVGARDFDERDRTMLSLVRGHFERARLNTERYALVAERGAAHGALTSRESQVAHWLSRGKTNPEIARILGMAPRTAEKHVEHVLEKLGVENRTEASLVLAGAPER